MKVSDFLIKCNHAFVAVTHPSPAKPVYSFVCTKTVVTTIQAIDFILLHDAVFVLSPLRAKSVFIVPGTEELVAYLHTVTIGLTPNWWHNYTQERNHKNTSHKEAASFQEGDRRVYILWTLWHVGMTYSCEGRQLRNTQLRCAAGSDTTKSRLPIVWEEGRMYMWQYPRRGSTR